MSTISIKQTERNRSKTARNLTYCDHDCYVEHCKSAFVLLEKRATAS
jgi:hypothetical protein